MEIKALNFYRSPEILRIVFAFFILSGYWFISITDFDILNFQVPYIDLIMLPGFVTLAIIVNFFGKQEGAKAIITGSMFIVFSFVAARLTTFLPGLKGADKINVPYDYYLHQQGKVTFELFLAFLVASIFVTLFLPWLRRCSFGKSITISLTITPIVACLLFHGMLKLFLSQGAII